ncbi:MAG: hypothetical protein IKO26_02170, partial [Paludibacteraceae bacterium]|nr:hypothetical protein [Paludibacteraceae bacterium]
RQAEAVVAQADSLWQAGKMYGIDEGDSASLAQACETLSTFNSPLLSTFNHQLSTDFSRLCYHYGRLLREKDNPVAAMQVFIDATHSRTRDYHILGRVYSNIGDLCHLAGDFPLSYDMFSRSADCFLKNGDTLLYYYDLNNMAFELAEQGKGKEVVALLDSIENNHSYPVLQTNIQETKMVLYKKLQQYDSVLYYANLLQSNRIKEPTVYLSKAQAFCYTYQYDSATYYADLTTNISKNLFHLNNAYYILIHCDSVHNGYKVYALSAKRADVQKQLEVRQGQMSQAVQLLEMDLTSKPDRGWLYAVIVTILIIGCLLSIYVCRQHKRRQLLSQQIDDYQQKRLTDLEISCTALRNNKNLKTELDWNHYDSMCTIVNSRLCGIADRLQAYPDITPNDIRLCVLVLLELSYDEIAYILNLSPKSIAKLKSLTAHKLGTTMKNLRNTLVQIACQNNIK